MEELSHVGMSQCFICGEAKNIILDRRLKNSLPRMACYDKEPCDKCKSYMAQGIILISVKDGETGNNPYRTGNFCVVKEKALEKMMDKDLFKSIQELRICYVEDSVWERIGLSAVK